MKEDGTVEWEKTVILYTYIIDDLFLQECPKLREFLHRFGREARQRETVFEFKFGGSGGSRFYRITKYDEAPP